MTDTTALDSFLDKWRTRWPEWRVVEVFVPEAQRALAVAWFALLQEFTDAMNIAGDPLPADAKLAWWGEELRDWQQQRSRHPLGRLLEPHRAPWFELAEVLPALRRMRETPGTEAEAFEIALPLADAIAAVERVLFAFPQANGWSDALAAQLLAARLEGGGTAAIPLQSGHQQALSQADWTARLLDHWSVRAAGPLPRRLASALARSQLQRFKASAAAVATLSPPRALWLGWRAARQA